METDEQYHQTRQMVLPAGSGRQVGRTNGHPIPVAQIYELKPAVSAHEDSAVRKMERLKRRILHLVPKPTKGAAHDPFAERLARLR